MATSDSSGYSPFVGNPEASQAEKMAGYSYFAVRMLAIGSVAECVKHFGE
jgi:hypothetical protein